MNLEFIMDDMPFLKNIIKKFDQFQSLELHDIYQTLYHNVVFVIYIIMDIPILKKYQTSIYVMMCIFNLVTPTLLAEAENSKESMLANRWCLRSNAIATEQNLIQFCVLMESSQWINQFTSVISKLSHFQIILMLLY